MLFDSSGLIQIFTLLTMPSGLLHLNTVEFNQVGASREGQNASVE
jgi:hypothetical protein